MYNKILVGIDGSEQADKAFSVGCELAKTLSAKLFLLWVINRDRGMLSSFGVNEDFYQDLYNQLKEKLNPYQKQAQSLNIEVTSKAVIGNVKTTLAKYFPEENNIDLIVLGNGKLQV